MRISGTEPSSVILGKTLKFKRLKSVDPNVPKKLKQKGCCNKPTNLQFQSISTRKYVYALKRYESTEVERRTGLHEPSGTLWSTSNDTHQVVEI